MANSGETLFEIPIAAASSLVARLKETRVSVATAESLTAGGVCAAIASIPGASAVLLGGICAYSAEIKAAVVGVDSQLLEHCGTVDPQVASQMAERVRKIFNADMGIATTGVAGPDTIEEKAVGTVYVAVAIAAQTRVRALKLQGSRAQIRSATIREACCLAKDML